MSAADSGLGRCGEAVWVGALTCVLSLPVVTALAAHAAGLRALDPALAGTPDLTARYWRAFRAALGPGLRLQLVWLVLAMLATADIAFGVLVAVGSVLGSMVGTLGAAGAVFLLLLCPGLAACLAAISEDEEQVRTRLGVWTTMRQALARVGVSPWRCLLLLVLDLAVVAGALVLLAVLPFALGLALLVQTRLLTGAAQQLRRRAARHRPQNLRSQPSPARQTVTSRSGTPSQP